MTGYKFGSCPKGDESVKNRMKPDQCWSVEKKYVQAGVDVVKYNNVVGTSEVPLKSIYHDMMLEKRAGNNMAFFALLEYALDWYGERVCADSFALFAKQSKLKAAA